MTEAEWIDSLQPGERELREYRAAERRVKAGSSSSPVPCSGALTWSAEKPKRAGWWWWKSDDLGRPSLVELYQHPSGALLVVRREGIIAVRKCGGWWAGPLVEPVEAPPVGPRPNEKLSDAP